MFVKRAYQYRFYPTPEQAKNLVQTFGCVRFAYNWALNKRKRAFFDQGVSLKTKELSAALTALKKAEGTLWLSEVSAVPLQQALRHLETLTLDVREWICEQCGVCHDRDVNAAANILTAGLAASACGGDVRPAHVKALVAIPVEAGKPLGDERNPLPF